MAKRICIDAGHGGKDPGAKSGNYLEQLGDRGGAFVLRETGNGENALGGRDCP